MYNVDGRGTSTIRLNKNVRMSNKEGPLRLHEQIIIATGELTRSCTLCNSALMFLPKIPYSLRSTEQIRDLVLQGERPPILSTDEMPLPMRQLISRCLHEDPEKRWSSFEKILEILRSPELERSIIVCTKSKERSSSRHSLVLMAFEQSVHPASRERCIACIRTEINRRYSLVSNLRVFCFQVRQNMRPLLS